MVLVEFDMGALRGEPEAPLVDSVRVWIEAAFRSAGADPRIGTRIGSLLRRAGFADVTTFGIQPSFAPEDPAGPMLSAAVTRSLAPQIVAQGIATDEELGLETLHERIAERVRERDAVVLAPTVGGRAGHAPARRRSLAAASAAGVHRERALRRLPVRHFRVADDARVVAEQVLDAAEDGLDVVALHVRVVRRDRRPALDEAEVARIVDAAVERIEDAAVLVVRRLDERLERLDRLLFLALAGLERADDDDLRHAILPSRGGRGIVRARDDGGAT
ncbi:MAG TPA: hypothetical protein VN213_01420 [Solirubrobacteraceae bacterium]|nr:hypothetical protein [Solirubrobacteraceae bacterium]